MVKESKDLYVLALFDNHGDFYEYVRKTRNYSIVGYDNLSSAKRGLKHTRRNNVRVINMGYGAKIMKVEKMIEVED